MIKNLIKLGIGIGILFYLIFLFNFKGVINTISGAQPLFLALSLVVYSITFLILTTRWRFILSNMGIAIPLTTAYFAFVGGVLLSDLTPSKIGEFGRPYLARSYMDMAQGISSVVFDKYMDISAVLFLSCLGLVLVYFDKITGYNFSYLLVWLLALTLIFVFVSVILWTKRTQALGLFMKIITKFHLSPITIFEKFDKNMGRIKNPARLIGFCLPLTVFVWFTHALRVFLIAKAVGFSVPLIYLVLLLPLVAALSLIPLSISGLGFVEAGIATVISMFGIPLYAGISIALLDRSLTFLFHACVGSRYVKDL
jgi:uncharacterized protein (TIRG00374 family)